MSVGGVFLIDDVDTILCKHSNHLHQQTDINNESESENEVDKMDIELAYDTYLKKRKEIMRMFEQMDQEYNNNENEVINLN